MHCAAVRLSFARNLSTACQSTRHTPWLPDWETDSRKAGKLDSRQFWPLFAAVKLCQTSFKSGEAAKTATTTTTTKMQPNENLSAKNSFGQGIYCGATGWSNVTTSHSSSQRQHTHTRTLTHAIIQTAFAANRQIGKTFVCGSPKPARQGGNVSTRRILLFYILNSLRTFIIKLPLFKRFRQSIASLVQHNERSSGAAANEKQKKQKKWKKTNEIKRVSHMQSA